MAEEILSFPGDFPFLQASPAPHRATGVSQALPNKQEWRPGGAGRLCFSCFSSTQVIPNPRTFAHLLPLPGRHPQRGWEPIRICY